MLKVHHHIAFDEYYNIPQHNIILRSSNISMEHFCCFAQLHSLCIIWAGICFWSFWLLVQAKAKFWWKWPMVWAVMEVQLKWTNSACNGGSFTKMTNGASNRLNATYAINCRLISSETLTVQTCCRISSFLTSCSALLPHLNSKTLSSTSVTLLVFTDS